MRTSPAGPNALLLECAGAGEVAAWHAELTRRRADGRLTVTELVPAARTILLDGLADPAATAAGLGGVTPGDRAAGTGTAGLVEIRCHYDGPDLAEVARLWDTTTGEVVRIHTGTEFRVAFCGFSPGFGYLTGLPPERVVPRRASPRARVPAGSVALAGEYSGVYPSESPGGWQLIGRTDARLFDVGREPLALFTPGTRVRFSAA